MHRGRFGGNARKRKAKLTDDTFKAMISPTAYAEAPVATIEPDAGDDTMATALGEVSPSMGAPVGQFARGTMRGTGRAFHCQDYQFGYTVCPNCHSDLAFYVHNADLAHGYTFRCRICRHVLTMSAES